MSTTSNIFSNVYIYGNCTVKGTLTTLGGSAVSQWTTGGSAIYYSTGNVGIGTATPGNILTISSSGVTVPLITSSSSGSASYINFTNSADSRSSFIGQDGSGLFAFSTGALALGTNSSVPIIFAPNYNSGGEKMRITPTGLVGIGTTNPGSLLTVSGGVGIGSGYNAFTAPTGGLIVQGNVGIGTTNPGVNALQVSGNVVTQGFTSNATNTVFNFDTLTVPFVNATQVGVGTTSSTYPFDVLGIVRAGSTVASSIYLTNSEVKWRGDGTAHFSIFNQNSTLQIRNTSANFEPGTAGSNLVTVTSTGSVGIGTTSPVSNLAVYATTTANVPILTLQDSSTGIVNFVPNTTSGAYNSLTTSGDQLIYFTKGSMNTGCLTIAPHNGGYMGIRIASTANTFTAAANTHSFLSNTSGAAMMTILGSGNVGIGKTNPGALLDVNGALAATSVACTSVTAQGTAAAGAIYMSGSQIEIGAGQTSDTTSYIDLHAAEGTYSDFAFRIIRYAGANANVHWINRGSGNSYFQNQDSGSFYFQSGGSNLVTVTSTGSVGIGTASPGSALHTAINSATATTIATFENLNTTTTTAKSFSLQFYGNGAGGQKDAGAITMIPTEGNFGYSAMAFSVRGPFGAGSSEAVSEVMRFSRSGTTACVGIGTTNPGYPLDVTGDMHCSGAFYCGNNSGATTAGSIGGRMFFGGTYGDQNYTDGGQILSRLYATTESSELVIFKGNDANASVSLADRIRLRAGAICFDTYTGASSDPAAENIRMVVDQNGNVGIGYNSPQSIMHVQVGDVVPSASGNMTTGLIISQASGGPAMCLGARTSGANYTWIHSAYTNNSSVTAPLALQPIGGYVGIGTTNPLYTLQVGANAGTIGSTTLHLANSYLDTNGNFGARITALDNGVNGHNLQIQTRATASGAFTNSVTVTASGRVGINSTGPNSQLEVNTTGTIGMVGTGSVWGHRIIYGSYGVSTYQDGSDFYHLITASGDQYGSYNGLRPFRFNLSSGYVTMDNGCTINGSGTVNGGLTSSGNITIGGTASFAGGVAFFGGNSGTNGFAIENQTTFTRIAMRQMRWYDWGGVGDFIYLASGCVGIRTSQTSSAFEVAGRSYIWGTSLASGGQNRFTGLDADSSANGRAQLVLNSSYSDMVISSSQYNGTHGSTVSFVTADPGNVASYKKFVINVGNWAGYGSGGYGDRMSFGWTDAAYTNPHSYVTPDDSVMCLWGRNKCVGINNVGSPGYNLHVNGNDYTTGGRYTSDYFRIYGSGGIYWQDYGGGWYMVDSTFMRVYGDKYIYTGGQIRCAGGFSVQDGTVVVDNGRTHYGYFRQYPDVWQTSNDGYQRFYFASAGRTYIKGNNGCEIRRSDDDWVGIFNNDLTIDMRSIRMHGQLNLQNNQIYLGTGRLTMIGGSEIYDDAQMRITTDDNMYFYASSDFHFYNGGSIRCDADIIAYASDERIKTRLGVIDNALDKVKQLTGFYYEHNELGKKFGFNDGGVKVGVSAQEVQKVMPEVVKPAPFDFALGVSTSGENYLTVQYEKLVPLLIESIKELSAKVDKLEKIISSSI
ncbi:hypothetical protein [Yellowstone lake phycodnavirus 2]|uniref:long tail fiber protein distal subunit n=1 Tax=Yellowstone lake phycodnavirus 2 TaxID=1586714 RepID=UPI0006EBD28B|nr:long tail fiber protein distal subunit [Yellowstone lake phycodnavirus 2]BAT22282.1 hypothetical protein [Yellowstone lake phycodnavirus 2]